MSIQDRSDLLRQQIVTEFVESDPVCASILDRANWVVTDFCVELTVPSGFALGKLEEKREAITQQVRSHLPGLTVNIVRDPAATPADDTAAGNREDDVSQDQSQQTHDHLPTFSFEEFVVGDSNQFAHALAMEMSQGGGPRIALICGDTGLGKTHLLKAAVRRFGEKVGAQALYVTGERFLNDFISSIRGGDVAMRAFRARYRGTALLVVDDIHFLARGKKEDTIQEFLSIWKDREERGAPMLLGSTETIKDLKFPPELQSRLRGACRAEIGQADDTLRARIILKMAEKLGMPLEKGWAQAIVESSGQDVRELTSALMRLHIYISRLGRKLDESLITELFESKPVDITFDGIVNAVAAHWGVSRQELLSRRKSRRLTDPRQMAMFLAFELRKDASFAQVGREFGRDHATVMHGHRKVLAKAASRAEVQREIQAIKTAVAKRA